MQIDPVSMMIDTFLRLAALEVMRASIWCGVAYVVARLLVLKRES